MQLRVLRFDDGDAFVARAGSFLLEREALHNLIYSIGAEAGSDPPPYLAAVERAGEIVLAAVRTPPTTWCSPAPPTPPPSRCSLAT
jgi:hypothetical protein